MPFHTPPILHYTPAPANKTQKCQKPPPTSPNPETSRRPHKHYVVISARAPPQAQRHRRTALANKQSPFRNRAPEIVSAKGPNILLPGKSGSTLVLGRSAT